VWSTVVFLLNVLAFLLVGLEARVAVLTLGREQLWHALSFAGVVVLVVIGVRIVWVMLSNRIAQPIFRLQGRSDAPSLAQGVVSAWCGMRGLVTLATALALPQEFPGRDLILLSALAVVLGTLIVQGITLGPLIRMLHFAADNSLLEELASARVVLLDLAIEGLSQRDDETARSLRDRYLTERSEAARGGPRTATAADDLHRQCIDTQRKKLFELWAAGEIDDDVFHSLELELDLQELASSPTDRFELIEE